MTTEEPLHCYDNSFSLNGARFIWKHFSLWHPKLGYSNYYCYYLYRSESKTVLRGRCFDSEVNFLLYFRQFRIHSAHETCYNGVGADNEMKTKQQKEKKLKNCLEIVVLIHCDRSVVLFLFVKSEGKENTQWKIDVVIFYFSFAIFSDRFFWWFDGELHCSVCQYMSVRSKGHIEGVEWINCSA